MWIRLIFAIATLFFGQPAYGVRAKDIATFPGVRENQLTGAGLVVGLRRTGDSMRNDAAIRSLSNRLQGLGVSLPSGEIATRNVAMVMVSATLGPDQRTGSRIGVTAASTGDATSLQGGILLMTPLIGADGKVYAVAEGPVTVGGYVVEADGNSARKNTPTTGYISGGALIEREVASAVDFDQKRQVEYILRKPDFTTANTMAETINNDFGVDIAQASSSSTINVTIPDEYLGAFARFAARLESLDIRVDAPARVVISERTGTVVMGANVQLAAVAVAHGGLTIEVRRRPEVSQPSAFGGGTTAITYMTDIKASEEDNRLVMVEGASIGQLVSALNAMGVNPRDLMVILQAIQAAGALHAEIVTL